MSSAADKLLTARIKLLLREPFFGTLVTRMQIIPSNQVACIATEGINIYYNEEWIDQRTVDECMFLMCHEILHVMYRHCGLWGRNGNRNHKIANYAQDYVINYELVDLGIGTMPTGDAEGLYDPKFAHMSFEEVYDELMKDAKKIEATDFFVFDEHMEPGGGGQGKSGDSNGEEGEGISAGNATAEDVERAMAQMQAAMISAAQVAKGAGKGKIPASVRAILAELEHPVMNWRELIQSTIKSLMKNDYTFARPSKKCQMSGIILPGYDTDELIHIAIGLDTSGSISNKMLREMLSEVYHAVTSFASFKLHLWCYDTRVHGYEEFDEFNVDDLLDYQPNGGGGTDFEVSYDFMEQQDIEPDLYINFTDGYPCGSWGSEAYCDTMFVIHGNTHVKPPFGTYAYYDGEK